MSMSAEPAVSQDAPPGSGGRVDRIASISALDTLERIQNSSLATTGAVNMIGLDAIRRKLGDRWPAKRARVWEHVEMELERRLGPADLAVRVDDINYLIALPSSSGFAAQALCLTILQDVLKFFLGEMKAGDISVRQVTEVTGTSIVSAPVDLSKLPRPGFAAPEAPAPAPAAAAEAPAEAAPAPAAAEHAGGLVEHEAPPKEWKPPLAGRSSIVELAVPKKPPFELELTVEPVWNLRRGLIMSFLIDRRGCPDGAEAAELEVTDVATFAYAATLLEEQATQGGPVTLHLPVSFVSLATQRTRVRLMQLTESVRESMRAHVLLEICGLDAGVPPSRLIEVVGLVRSLCAGVLGRVRPSKASLAAAKGCGLRGLVVEAPFLGLTQPEPETRLKAFVAAARTISPNLVIHGLPAQTLIDAATAAGFSHASAVAEDE
jgi:hypothetical protein